jgi:hypothetical protein
VPTATGHLGDVKYPWKDRRREATYAGNTAAVVRQNPSTVAVCDVVYYLQMKQLTAPTAHSFRSSTQNPKKNP